MRNLPDLYNWVRKRFRVYYIPDAVRPTGPVPLPQNQGVERIGQGVCHMRLPDMRLPNMHLPGPGVACLQRVLAARVALQPVYSLPDVSCLV